MLRDLKLNVFYPYPPERVWKAIANRRALAAWFMDNDFEPRLGHKFRFKPEQSGEDTIYQKCDCASRTGKADRASRLSLQTFEHLKHQLDWEAAQNSPEMQQDMAELQRVVTEWFSQHLTS